MAMKVAGRLMVATVDAGGLMAMKVAGRLMVATVDAGGLMARTVGAGGLIRGH